tara:strand:- start:2106 stop:2279 length:174 start_codon:yes stop_codon:yes gene_type:complete
MGIVELQQVKYLERQGIALCGLLAKPLHIPKEGLVVPLGEIRNVDFVGAVMEIEGSS